MNKTETPRLRLMSKVDLTKSDKSCNNCFGTGIAGYKTIEDHEGSTVKAPIICKCVSRNGGIEPDKLDKILMECQASFADGSFGEKLANDILKMSEAGRERALHSVVDQMRNPDTSEIVKSAMQRCIDLVNKKGAN